MIRSFSSCLLESRIEQVLAALGIAPSANASADYWRVRAEMFFDAFERYYAFREPGTTMGL